MGHAFLLGIVVICLVATFLLGVSFGRQEKRHEEDVLDLRARFDGYREQAEPKGQVLRWNGSEGVWVPPYPLPDPGPGPTDAVRW
jgi:hypothetical protein